MAKSWKRIKLRSSFQEFSDVTLVCDDDKQVFAHKVAFDAFWWQAGFVKTILMKVILSACSPFFRRILLNNPHQHPLIYLTGVSKHFLTSMVWSLWIVENMLLLLSLLLKYRKKYNFSVQVAFMYLGQTNVAQVWIMVSYQQTPIYK